MGRPKGARNKATEVREHFTEAWNKHGGKAAALRLVKSAVERALGYDAVERVYEYEPDPKDAKKRVRVLVKEKVTREHSTDLLALFLPYVAQQLPRLSEFTGKDGAPLVPPAPTLPPINFDKWTEAQIDAFIAATAAAHAAQTAKLVPPAAPGAAPPAEPPPTPPPAAP